VIIFVIIILSINNFALLNILNICLITLKINITSFITIIVRNLLLLLFLIPSYHKCKLQNARFLKAQLLIIKVRIELIFCR